MLITLHSALPVQACSCHGVRLRDTAGHDATATTLQRENALRCISLFGPSRFLGEPWMTGGRLSCSNFSFALFHLSTGRRARRVSNRKQATTCSSGQDG